VLVLTKLKTSQIKAVTKTVENPVFQRVGGCCEPIAPIFKTYPFRAEELNLSVSFFRECCVSATGLIDLKEAGFFLQFEWYRGYYYSSQSETVVSFWGVFYLCFFDYLFIS